jgi:hypothetical protein
VELFARRLRNFPGRFMSPLTNRSEPKGRL